jgi:hypothetical protein
MLTQTTICSDNCRNMWKSHMFVVKMFHIVAQTKLQLGHKCRIKCPILIRSCYGVIEHSSCHQTACIHHDRYQAQDNKRTELEVQCSDTEDKFATFSGSHGSYLSSTVPTGFDTMQDHRLTLTLQRKWWNYGQVEAEVFQGPPNQPTTNQKASCQYLIINSAISVHARLHRAMTWKLLNYKLTDLSSWLINFTQSYRFKMKACHFRGKNFWWMEFESRVVQLGRMKAFATCEDNAVANGLWLEGGGGFTV